MKKKALIFDLDNTLWEGVIGEGSIRIDFDIVDEIKLYARKGVIICLCSKNNEEDVMNILNKVDLMKFISAYRINWQDKVQNIREIVEELNIGMDSVVFVDDQRFERELVSGVLPEVVCIHPRDLTRVVLDNFDLTGSLLKTEQYQANKKREESKAEFQNIDDFLKSLNMVLSIHINDYDHINRIVELTQKTNQFNLTTHRYSEEEIRTLMQFPNFIYSLLVKDKFGDNGLVGVCIVRCSMIDTFLLSCRVLGRGIEFAFMDYIIKDLIKRGFKCIVSKYVESKKNGQTKDFYTKCGFRKINLNLESVTFSLSFDNYNLTVPEHFKYE
jgi:FkbH-like protein